MRKNYCQKPCPWMIQLTSHGVWFTMRFYKPGGLVTLTCMVSNFLYHRCYFNPTPACGVYKLYHISTQLEIKDCLVLQDLSHGQCPNQWRKGCWELCNFPTPSDLIPMGHGIKARTHIDVRDYIIPNSTTARAPGTTWPVASWFLDLTVASLGIM